MEGELPFWERPETVERFAGREPDLRLQSLVGEFDEPEETCILDLGCAGGRNSIFLAERGFDFLAVDASEAMVAETRRRVAAILGPLVAESRVRRGRMDDLGFLPDRSVHLIVALGVYHSAASRDEWDRALAEAARVLRPGGRLLVANHTDEADLDGTGLEKLPGDDPIYLRRSGPSFLVSAEVLDEEMARHGLEPLTPTETVRRDTDSGGVRVTANGLYRNG